MDPHPIHIPSEKAMCSTLLCWCQEFPICSNDLLKKVCVVSIFHLSFPFLPKLRARVKGRLGSRMRRP